MASKGESKATCFGSRLQLPPAKIGKVPAEKKEHEVYAILYLFYVY